MKPYGNTPAARMVDDALRTVDATAAEVARGAGLRANFLSMIRTGESVLPPMRCRALANALGIAEGELAEACLVSYADSRSWALAGMARAS